MAGRLDSRLMRFVRSPRRARCPETRDGLVGPPLGTRDANVAPAAVARCARSRTRLAHTSSASTPGRGMSARRTRSGRGTRYRSTSRSWARFGTRLESRSASSGRSPGRSTAASRSAPTGRLTARSPSSHRRIGSSPGVAESPGRAVSARRSRCRSPPHCPYRLSPGGGAPDRNESPRQPVFPAGCGRNSFPCRILDLVTGGAGDAPKLDDV